MTGRRLLRRAAFVGLSVFLAFVVMEGLASAVLTVGRLVSPDPPPRPSAGKTPFVQYDADIGWVGLPNLAVADMWGPGRSLHTNAHGFRGRLDPGPSPPPGKIRVLCSGDSFTFGLGIADEHTWCEALNQIDGRLETINMGQNGYGVDQSFLWYRRDGAALEPAIHVLAIIDDDIERMRLRTFSSYEKPILALRGSELHVENVPVPRRPPTHQWWGPWPIFEGLKVSELVTSLRWRLGGISLDSYREEVEGTVEETPLHQVESVALRVFAELRDTARSHGGEFVLVRLPVVQDCRASTSLLYGPGWWPSFVRRVRELGIEAVDLTETCRQLSMLEINELYLLGEDEVFYVDAVAHYSEHGSRVMARALHARLQSRIDRLMSVKPSEAAPAVQRPRLRPRRAA